jgi:hypothetical protein
MSTLFAYPNGLTVVRATSLPDANHRTIRKIASNGSVTTIAGTAAWRAALIVRARFQAASKLS